MERWHARSLEPGELLRHARFCPGCVAPRGWERAKGPSGAAVALVDERLTARDAGVQPLALVVEPCACAPRCRCEDEEDGPDASSAA